MEFNEQRHVAQAVGQTTHPFHSASQPIAGDRLAGAVADHRVLVSQGPLTVVELGKLLRRAPQALYYHVHLLVDEGLLVVDGIERTLRRDRKRYRLVAPRLRLEATRGSREFNEALAAAASTLLRTALRNYCLAAQAGNFELSGPKRNLVCRRFHVRLDANRQRRLNDLIDQISQLLAQDGTNDDGFEQAVTIAVSPIVAPSGKR